MVRWATCLVACMSEFTCLLARRRRASVVFSDHAHPAQPQRKAQKIRHLLRDLQHGDAAASHILGVRAGNIWTTNVATRHRFPGWSGCVLEGKHYGLVHGCSDVVAYRASAHDGCFDGKMTCVLEISGVYLLCDSRSTAAGVCGVAIALSSYP